MEHLGYFGLPKLALALGATAPNPGAAGFVAWSTILGEVVAWDGDSWERPPGNAGAANLLQSISVSTVASLPTTYGPGDWVIAKVAENGNTYMWAGFNWGVMAGVSGIPPIDTFGVATVLPVRRTTITVPFPVTDSWEQILFFTGYLAGMRVTASAVPDTPLTYGGTNDDDESEFGGISIHAVCEVDGQIKLYCRMIDGPVDGEWRVEVRLS